MRNLFRKHIFSKGIAICLVAMLASTVHAATADKPNIVIIWGDDIGQSNVSAYSMGLMGYQTPNIDRVAKEGMIFTDYYAEQSCTAGRASFITGQSGFRASSARTILAIWMTCCPRTTVSTSSTAPSII
jgi:arylsulfatase